MPRQARGTFAGAVPCLVATWALGGLYLSLGPSLAAQVTGSRNLLWGGLVIFLICGTGAGAAFALRGIGSRAAMLAGCLFLLAGVAVTFGAIATTTPAAFVAGPRSQARASACLPGRIPDDHRPGHVRGAGRPGDGRLCGGLLCFSVPALIAGVATTKFGLHSTALVYSASLAALVATAVGICCSPQRPGHHASHGVACGLATGPMHCTAELTGHGPGRGQPGIDRQARRSVNWVQVNPRVIHGAKDIAGPARTAYFSGVLPRTSPHDLHTVSTPTTYGAGPLNGASCQYVPARRGPASRGTLMSSPPTTPYPSLRCSPAGTPVPMNSVAGGLVWRWGMSKRFELRSALMDRQRERAALDGFLGELRTGRGGALIVHGEAGVGKSALLEYAVGSAADMRVAQAVGVESDWSWRSPACICCARRYWTG